jgi:hypothetical protein
MSNPPVKMFRCEASYQGDPTKPNLGMDLLRWLTCSVGDTPWEKISYQIGALANDVRCIWREWRYWSRFHNFRRIK